MLQDTLELAHIVGMESQGPECSRLAVMEAIGIDNGAIFDTQLFAVGGFDPIDPDTFSRLGL